MIAAMLLLLAAKQLYAEVIKTKIEVCKWYQDANSPVLLMVDDLTNAWVDLNNNGSIDLGEDWGYHCDRSRSSYAYLTQEILEEFPEVKVVFYVPIGPREPMLNSSSIKSVARRIDADASFKKFLQKVAADDRFEVAYHGTTHGRCGKNRHLFRQEWETFITLEEALKTIRYGKEIYKQVLGVYPAGGKYCGYRGGIFGDRSIDKSGFAWWNRYWNRGVASASQCDTGGDANPITNYDLKTFGSNAVVDIPSTIAGSMLTGFLSFQGGSVKNMIKHFLRSFAAPKMLAKLQYLLDNKLIISIQEHISFARNDGRRQKPNIFDDINSLKAIFEYLKNKNVWYCTGTELAHYYRLREGISIFIKDNTFRVDTDLQDIKQEITLKLTDGERSSNKVIICPNKCIVPVKAGGHFSVEVMDGDYIVA